MADGDWRIYSLSFVATADDSKASLVVQLGREAGEVWLDDLQLRQGPSDVMFRRFEHGVVLLNASVEPVSFDLGILFPGVKLRRISGTQDPSVNTGALTPPVVTVLRRDALILLVENG